VVEFVVPFAVDFSLGRRRRPDSAYGRRLPVPKPTPAVCRRPVFDDFQAQLAANRSEFYWAINAHLLAFLRS
jgi:hypothetical protein